LGTQSIGRAVAVLRAIAQAGAEGRRVSDVATELDLNVATTHRLLSALAREGLVERNERTKLYRIGPEILALGAGVQRRFSIEEHFSPVLARLAEQTEDTVFLYIRSGNDAVCVARREGAFPIRTLTVDVGSRRPLGIGAGSLALLAFLPASEQDVIIRANAKRYPKFGLTASDVAALARRSSKLGYALNDGRILRDMTAVGVPVATVSGRIVAAISVSAINARMSPSRRERVVKMLRAETEGRSPLPE